MTGDKFETIPYVIPDVTIKEVEGNGIFADMLIKRGIDVITEKETIKW